VPTSSTRKPAVVFIEDEPAILFLLRQYLRETIDQSQ